MLKREKEFVYLTTPLTDTDVEQLKAGDRVLISGIVYAARDAAHKKMLQLIQEGKNLPFDIKGQIIYYVGPTPARPGRVIGSAGPTTSSRMDKATPPLLKLGLKGTLGKGERSESLRKEFVKYKAVYFAALGGLGALLSKKIKSVEVVAWDELGPEALRKMQFENFPAIVINDIYGNDFYIDTQSKFSKL
jgi:fumarate hydratase subunit beta